MWGVLQLRFGTVRFAFAIYCQLFRLSMLPPLAPLHPVPARSFFYLFVVESKISNWFLCCALCFTRFSFLLCALRTHLAKRRKVNANIIWLAGEMRRLRSRVADGDGDRDGDGDGEGVRQQQHFHRRLRSMRFRSVLNAVTYHSVDKLKFALCLCLRLCLHLPLFHHLPLHLPIPAWLLAAAPLLPRCKLQLQLLFAVSFFIFESSSCTRSMESSASHSSPTPTPTPASASSPAWTPSAVPTATAAATLFHAVCEYQSFAFNAAFPRIYWMEVEFRLEDTLQD